MWGSENSMKSINENELVLSSPICVKVITVGKNQSSVLTYYLRTYGNKYLLYLYNRNLN